MKDLIKKNMVQPGPLHDPCVTAYLIDPTIFSGRKINVEIETESELTLGMTVADWWRVTDRELMLFLLETWMLINFSIY